jgi:hypothetical protein
MEYGRQGYEHRAFGARHREGKGIPVQIEHAPTPKDRWDGAVEDQLPKLELTTG